MLAILYKKVYKLSQEPIIKIHMRKIFYLVMLTLGVVLASCSPDWWEQKKYGENLSFEDITVRGNTVFVELPDGGTATLSLSAVCADKDSLVFTDTIKYEPRLDEAECSGYNLKYRSLKEKKGNMRISDALEQTSLLFAGYHIPITFRHQIVSVVDKKGNETVYEPEMTYATQLSPLSIVKLSTDCSVANYQLVVNVFDHGVSVGTVETVLQMRILNELLK